METFSTCRKALLTYYYRKLGDNHFRCVLYYDKLYANILLTNIGLNRKLGVYYCHEVL